MGVMNCFRNGCDNIMCDRYSRKYGYICNECFDELVDLGIEANIERFMNTQKKHHLEGMAEIAANRFKLEFPTREEEEARNEG